MTIGQRIKTLRKEHHLTQLELAKKIKSQQPQVNKWEAGIKTPSLPMLKKIAHLFNISLDTLVMDDKDLDILKVKDKSLLNKLKNIDKLNEHDKQIVINLIDTLIKK